MTMKTKRIIAGYGFISPVLLGILMFTVGPIFFSLYVSFTEYDNISKPVFIGIDNYTRIFKDNLFLSSIGITFKFAIVSIVTSLFLSFFLAYMLNAKVKGISVFRTIFYTPVIIPAIAGSFIFSDLFNVNYGWLNMIIEKMGFQPYAFLSSEKTALTSVIIYSLWGMGGSMLIWLAGFKGIPPSIYEAAEIDGANGWHKLLKITIPMSTPIIFYNLITGVIGNLQAFGQFFIMTNGGPNGSTTTMVLNIYNNGISYLEMGYASSQAWLVFLIIFVLTMIVFKTSGWVYYGESGS